MKKVAVNTKLNLTKKDIEEAIGWVDRPYIYQVTTDDMDTIMIDYNEPEDDYMVSEQYHEFEMEDGATTLNTYTFKQWLERYNMTAYRLSKLSDVSTSQIYKLMNNEIKLQNMQYNTVASIAKAFDMGADMFVSFIEVV